MLRVLKVVAIAGLVVFQSCDKSPEWQSTESGLEYMFLAKGEGQQIDSGSILLLNMVYKVKIDSTGKDTVLFDTKIQETPVLVPHGNVNKLVGGIEEGFELVSSKGDSLMFKVNSHKLFTNTFRAQLPDFIDSASSTTFVLGVKDVLDQEGVKKWRAEASEKARIKHEAEAVIQLEKDEAAIDAYLSSNNIDAQKTETGISYVITQVGSGDNAQAGQKVAVNYSGYVLEGAYFDSSIEEVAKANDIFTEGRDYVPYEFTLGQGAVIKGWDEGITLLNKGAKATLYIPSTLGYGNRQRSEVIVENSILVFDVELVEIN